MNKQVYLKCYNMKSGGGRELAEALDIRRLREDNSRFEPRPHRTIINWGCSEFPEPYLRCKVINFPKIVAEATNKLSFFQKMSKDTSVVPWTADREVAKQWLSEGHIICARQKLRASSGDGLVLFDAMQSFVQAPLWTCYIKKKDEYRVHIMSGEVISVQRKAIRSEGAPEDVDHRVRNLANGYVFVRGGVDPPADVLGQSRLAIRDSGLVFGAVDVLWNERRGKAYVLEINTAPGLEGQTITDYATGFKKLLGV